MYEVDKFEEGYNFGYSLLQLKDTFPSNRKIKVGRFNYREVLIYKYAVMDPYNPTSEVYISTIKDRLGRQALTLGEPFEFRYQGIGFVRMYVNYDGEFVYMCAGDTGTQETPISRRKNIRENLRHNMIPSDMNSYYYGVNVGYLFRVADLLGAS